MEKVAAAGKFAYDCVMP